MNNGQTPLTLSLRVGGGDCAAAVASFLKRHRSDNESSPFKLSPPLPLLTPYTCTQRTDGMTLMILGWPLCPDFEDLMSK